MMGFLELGEEWDRRSRADIGRRKGRIKKRSEDLFPKISRFLWKFLVPIKYRNCDFSSVS